MTSLIPKKYTEKNATLLQTINDGRLNYDYAAGGVVAHPKPAKLHVYRTRKGWVWEQRAYYGGGVGAVSPKTYDTKSNAVRAARRQASLLRAAEVIVHE